MKDDAVSPVVGVMLLIALTVIMAGILAAFAGGMTDGVAPAPVTDISAEFIGSDENITLRLSHNGGDSLTPREIKISSFVKTGGNNAGGESLMLSDVYSQNSWNTGDILVLTPTDTQALLGLDAAEILNAAQLSTPVDFRIYHLPSAETLAQISILLEES